MAKLDSKRNLATAFVVGLLISQVPYLYNTLFAQEATPALDQVAFDQPDVLPPDGADTPHPAIPQQGLPSGQLKTRWVDVKDETACLRDIAQYMANYQRHNENAMGFSSQLRTPSLCYCRLWKHFERYAADFAPGPAEALVHNTLEDAVKGSVLKFGTPSTRRVGISVGPVNKDTIQVIGRIIPFNRLLYLFDGYPAKRAVYEKVTSTMKDVTVVSEAVSDAPGTGMMDLAFLQEVADNPFAKLMPPGAEKRQAQGRTMRVPVTTLDNYFAKEFGLHTNVTFAYLHIGVSSSLVRILNGSKRILQGIKVVAFECHHRSMMPRFGGHGGSHQELGQLFSREGFVVFKVSWQQWLPISHEFYHPIIDDEQQMDANYCIALRLSDPSTRVLFGEKNLFSECETK